MPQNSPPRPRAYGVLPAPEAGLRLKRGFDQLARVLAVTLGPAQGNVLSYRPASRDDIEMLSDAATIARRVLQLPDRGEDVGAMLLRNLVWRVHTRVGDGCATTAVLAQSLLDQAHRAVAAGANPMILRRGIDAAARAALAALEAQAQPVTTEDDLIRVAYAITGDPDLSLVLGEMFHILGPEAHIDIKDYLAPYIEREYLEGGRWQGQLASPYLYTDDVRRRAVVKSSPVVLIAGTLATLDDLRPILACLSQLNSRKLVVIAEKITGVARQALVANHRQEKLHVVAAELKRAGAKLTADFEDLATLTGAEIIGNIAGPPLQHLRPAYFGVAQRVEATADDLIVVGDRRHHSAVRARIATLRAHVDALPVGGKDEDQAREDLQFRLARLAGQIGVLKIGAFTKTERNVKRQHAEKALRALPSALRMGVAPGGGVGYLNCIPAVDSVAVASDEAAWGKRIVAHALEAPFRQIVRNVGKTEPSMALYEARRRGPDFGYDAIADQVAAMREAGILDAVGVLHTALATAVSGAMMALTTEVTVLKRRPRTSLEP
ncbi:MAG: TCP-1/cpn60 chaperonin family protein [Anaerolineales bacterium]